MNISKNLYNDIYAFIQKSYDNGQNLEASELLDRLDEAKG